MNREQAREEAQLWHGQVIEWSAALDRTLPTARRHKSQFGVRIINPHTSEDTIMLTITALSPLLRRKHGLIVDDDASALPYFNVGVGRSRSSNLYLRRYAAFPVNDGGRKLHDNGDPFDATVWFLGPYRYHHIKIRKVDDFSDRPIKVLPPDHIQQARRRRNIDEL